jgi:hypothetical protein
MVTEGVALLTKDMMVFAAKTIVTKVLIMVPQI